MDDQTALPVAEGDAFMSPTSFSPFDEYSANPRFIELQEELRGLLAGVSSLYPSKSTTPEPTTTDGTAADPPEGPSGPSGPSPRNLDFSMVSIPKMKLVNYLKNWVIECAPYLDKFDEARHFGIQVPLMAQSSPALFYAVLAFSARQMERKKCLETSCDSLELYQESIRLLAPGLHAKDPNMLVTACILAVLELMSGSPRNWRQHIEGCAALFAFYEVTGFSGSLLQAVFWCYARMELCGAIISAGAESTVLGLDKWVPPAPEGVDADDFVKSIFYQKGRETPDMHANWAVYLCAKACDLVHRRVRHLELGEPHGADDGRPFVDRWRRLWAELQFWRDARPTALLPIMTTEATGGHNNSQIFPIILFSHRAAISSNQLYHAACILMLDIKPSASASAVAEILPPPEGSAAWHARRVCGISWTNPHRGNLINAIQPLYIAGRLLSHPREHLEVARLFKIIDRTTGWGAIWRLKDLEAEWGYEPGEILSMA